MKSYYFWLMGMLIFLSLSLLILFNVFPFGIWLSDFIPCQTPPENSFPCYGRYDIAAIIGFGGISLSCLVMFLKSFIKPKKLSTPTAYYPIELNEIVGQKITNFRRGDFEAGDYMVPAFAPYYLELENGHIIDINEIDPWPPKPQKIKIQGARFSNFKLQTQSVSDVSVMGFKVIDFVSFVMPSVGLFLEKKSGKRKVLYFDMAGGVPYGMSWIPVVMSIEDFLNHFDDSADPPYLNGHKCSISQFLEK